jgi:DNA-binding transcriptional LysR family regulator
MSSSATLPPFTFQQLQTFVELARRGKQSAVESALGKSQAQISRDLSALERELGGVCLFDRGSRTLTRHGETFLHHAREMLAGWRRLESSLSGIEDERGACVLAAEPDVVSGNLIYLLGQLRRQAPELSATLLVRSAESAAGALQGGEADLAVFAAPRSGDIAGLSARPFLSGRIFCVLPRVEPWLRIREVTANRLKGQALLLPPPGSSLRESVLEHVSGASSRPPDMIEVDSDRPALFQAVGDRLGVGFLFSFSECGPDTRSLPAGVLLRPVSRRWPPVGFNLWMNSSRPARPPVIAFARHLLRSVQ